MKQGINNNDIVEMKNIQLTPHDLEICKSISNNTSETWQNNRTPDEKLRDTCLGKFAEKAIKNFFSQDCHKNFNPYVAFYDDFRIDNYKYHNSVDFLFSKRIHHLLSAQRFIQENMSDGNSKFDLVTKERFKIAKIGIGEIKATRIAPRMIKDEKINFPTILRDDFLTYPKFTRKSEINTATEYLSKFSQERNLSIDQILQEERNNLVDWYFRVYIKENNEIGTCDAYIIGALPAEEFINSFNIKKFLSPKSNSAIYLSVPLIKGYSIEEFKNNFIPTTPFPNHFSSIIENELCNDLVKTTKNKL